MESLTLSPPLHYSPLSPSKLHYTNNLLLSVPYNTAVRAKTTLSAHPHRIIGHDKKKSFKLFTATSPFETETIAPEENKFDWYSEWYPVMPVCDLDKRVPHGKKVIGIDVVVWWDRNDSQWKVFDDSCPHRLAPLSEGRIDGSGRLQCVYHGWCFGGSGECQLIPQAPPDGPPVHSSKKACARVYPSTVQNDIVWFWPSSDPQHADILAKKKPPYISEIDDPSFCRMMGNRDIPIGYEILVENLLDPAHIHYAHYGIMQMARSKNPVDKEGGMPLDLSVKSLGARGFTGNERRGFTANSATGLTKFYAPCVVYFSFPLKMNQNDVAESSDETETGAEKRNVLVFMCVPVSPGKSRLIWTFPRNFMLWIDQVVPRWVFHINQNLIIDSDLFLLHFEERKFMESDEWQKVCYVPTKSDAYVVSFRKWLNKYAAGQVDWRSKFSPTLLPPTPPREQLLDRYWTHVVSCRSCSGAYKSLKVLKLALQVMSVCVLGIVAATKRDVKTSTVLALAAVLCFAASKWLSRFIRKSFHFHDYNHAFR